MRFADEPEPDPDGHGVSDADDEVRSPALGILPALPQDARQHPSWVDPPSDERALAAHRRALRQIAAATGKRLQASIDLGASEEIIASQKREYSVQLCMIITARAPGAL